jgi:hypothetical protein
MSYGSEPASATPFLVAAMTFQKLVSAIKNCHDAAACWAAQKLAQ